MQKKIIQHLAEIFLSASHSSSQKRYLILLLIDTLTFLLAIYISLAIRFNTLLPLSESMQYGQQIFFLILIKQTIFIVTGAYRSILSYPSEEFLATAGKATLLSFSLCFAISYLLNLPQLPRSVVVNDALLTLALVVSSRIFFSWLVHRLNLIGGHNQTIGEIW